MESERFQEAISRFDAANAEDPRGLELPYAERLSRWVERLAPAAAEELRLAARAQHICRWEIPRNDYPAGRVGYLKWRQDLKQFHADRAGRILAEVGYEPPTISRVQDLIRKRDFPRDPDGRVLEDALCLVFLETQFGDVAAKTEKQKMLGIIRKTWQKMTVPARAIALELPMGTEQRTLIDEALGGPAS